MHYEGEMKMAVTNNNVQKMIERAMAMPKKQKGPG